MTRTTAITISGPTVGLPRKVPLSERLGIYLYRRIRQLRRQDEEEVPPKDDGAKADSDSGSDAQAPEQASPIRLVCIADTHNTKPANLPAGDVLVHAGDLSQYGTFAEIQAQLAWLAALPGYAHKLVVAGNHDLLLDSAFVAAHPDRELDRRPGQTRADLDWGDLHYLEHGSLLELPVAAAAGADGRARTLRVAGSPWTPRCGSWAFQYGREESAAVWGSVAGAHVDVLVVHGPPLGHVDDGGKGCRGLAEALWRSRPGVLVCGHIHAGRGRTRLFFDRAQADYEAVLAGAGEQRQWWRAWTAVLRLAVAACWLGLARRALRGPGPAAGTTQMVNAAVVAGRGNRESLPATVVDLYV